MPKVWGGRPLLEWGKALPDGQAVGESWELADLPEGRTRIANGRWAGRTLHDLLLEDAHAVLGECRLTPEGGFPLLLKYLDAREPLSVQVDPPATYVAEHPGTHLKSEGWYIVDAVPGASIFKGVRPDTSPRAFASAIASGDVVEHLIEVRVTPGEFHYLPSGTCHALGAGILVAEIQTPSDTTFRIHDWNRRPERPLHVEEALECVHFGAAPPPVARPTPLRTDDFVTLPLIRNEHFDVERILARRDAVLAVDGSGRPVALMLVQGEGVMRWPGGGLEVSRGATILVPAALHEARFELSAGSTVLWTSPAGRTATMLA